MPATKTQKQKPPQGPVFPDQNSFDFFLEEVEYAALGSGVKRENIRAMLEHLTEKYGQNLPEEEDV